MSLAEITQSSGWKNFMAKLYGMGATVVIIGALAKINHWPGGSIIITVGLLVEAVIFFFSSFEPLHEELDWTLVYPELAGMTDPDELEGFKEEAISEREDKTLKNFDDLLKNSNIDTESISKLGEGITKLNQTASNLSDISDASLVTNEYFSNLKRAAESVNSLSTAYNQSGENLNSSVNQLVNSYDNAAGLVKKSGDDIASSYEKFSGSMVTNLESITSGNSSYKAHLDILSKNLSELNAVYELQLKNNNEHLENSKGIYSGFNQMMKNLEDSVGETKKYKDELSVLSTNLNKLNSIYGNMLSAMSVVSSK